MKIIHVLLMICGALLLSHCGTENISKITPGNLQVTTTIASDGSGVVSFLATADNTDKFGFYFGDNIEIPEYSTNGKVSHMYQTSGTFTVKVIAYSLDNISIERIIDITVEIYRIPFTTIGYTTPMSYSGMTLVWQDEFNGDHLNTSSWNYETGPFNNELQYYKVENTMVYGGYLIIEARQESTSGKLYTSSRLTTENKREFKYGRIDIRALMPKGQGMFPALWMLGSSFAEVSWPKCGEIDIMETIGGNGRDSVVYGTAHWDSLGHVYYGGHKGLTNGHVLGDEFHVYSIVWSSNEIKWYLDDVIYHVIDLTPIGLTELRKDFFFIFNVAIGGEWAGNPDSTTSFPQQMFVDYVRVFQY